MAHLERRRCKILGTVPLLADVGTLIVGKLA